MRVFVHGSLLFFPFQALRSAFSLPLHVALDPLALADGMCLAEPGTAPLLLAAAPHGPAARCTCSNLRSFSSCKQSFKSFAKLRLGAAEPLILLQRRASEDHNTAVPHGHGLVRAKDLPSSAVHSTTLLTLNDAQRLLPTACHAAAVAAVQPTAPALLALERLLAHGPKDD